MMNAGRCRIDFMMCSAPSSATRNGTRCAMRPAMSARGGAAAVAHIVAGDYEPLRVIAQTTPDFGTV